MPEIIYSHPKSHKPKKVKHTSYKIKPIIYLILIIAIILLIYIQVDKKIIPSVMAMAKMEGNTVATKAVNQGITKALATHETKMEDLISYDYNEKGEIISWNVNSIVINNLCASIVENAMDELQNIGLVKFKVPIGNATGSRLFANLGPQIGINLLPVGTVLVNYDNAIRSTGINQVNHTVWLNVEAKVQVVIPLSSEEIVVKRKVVLIDKVISGAVPPNYVNVPKDDILESGHYLSDNDPK